jgi:serine phosphatase RsbU (regulator of sigma subunit)
MFEEKRLEELVLAHRGFSAAGLETVIAETVIAHAEGRLQDDLTLVVAAIS